MPVVNIRRTAAVVCVIAVSALVIAWQRANTTPEADKNATATSLPHHVKAFPTAIDQRPMLLTTGKTVELCGYGQITVENGGDIYPAQVRAAATSTIGRVLDAYIVDPDPSTRAIGLLVQALAQGSAVSDLYRSTRVGCDQDAECMQRAHTATVQAMRINAERLALEIATMREPKAYALALYSCRRAYPDGTKIGPCARVTPAQWALLEPENVIPWLAEASLAISRGDDFTRDTALQQAAAAKTSRLHWEAILAIAEHQLVKHAPPATRLAALAELLGMHAALQTPALQVIGQQCGHGVEKNVDRQHLCSGVATALAAGNTLLELSIAARIGDRAGWSSDRTNVLQDKVDAIRQATGTSADSTDFWSCKYLENVEAHTAALRRHGEVGAGERALEKASYAEGDLARQWRERVRRSEKNTEGTRNSSRVAGTDFPESK